MSSTTGDDMTTDNLARLYTEVTGIPIDGSDDIDAMNPQWLAHLYGRALDEVYQQRALLAWAAGAIEASMELKGYPKSRRGPMANVVETITEAARGGVTDAFPRLRHPKDYLARAGAPKLLTRGTWEAELADRHPSRRSTR
ncbi:hypothetical protein DVS28_b0371 (plasmid) [Euzebya pacifica]|uniref:Uncharacterized protein n=1 Tax=Euzebya pacifica TaxID=1608957 RepID=A0A346Y6P4_9ACTN|nr:hypothetical protein [Euzebya pacifica]AXV10141.1 hypothetical protein DVS28_b0371 [Euzebya pacifica]